MNLNKSFCYCSVNRQTIIFTEQHFQWWYHMSLEPYIATGTCVDEQKALAKWGAANPKIEPMPHKYATYKPHYYQHAHAKILIFVCWFCD